MKFSCTRENLLRAINLTIHIASKNIQLPILNNVLISASGSQVVFSSTNLEVASTITIRARVEKEGQFTIPSKTFADVVMLNSADHFDFELRENGECLIVGGQTKIEIKGNSADDFPVIPTINDGTTLELKASKLKAALEETVFASAKNEIRPELSGVVMKISTSETTFASTDSFRLAEKKVKAGAPVEKTVIIPARAVYEMIRVISSADQEKNATLNVGDTQTTLNIDGAVLITRLVDGKYPDYTQIIPNKFITKITQKRDELLKQVKGAGIFSTGGVNAINISADPETSQVLVEAEHPQLGKYDSSYEAKITGEKKKVVLNYRYLIDGISVMPSNIENVSIELSGSDSPCVIKGEDYKDYIYVIMPIRQ